MRRVVTLALLTAILYLRATTNADLVAQEATLRSRTELVTIDAYAHDGGRPLDHLTAADFLVRDNGVEQAIHALGTTDNAHVIVVFDTSGSVVGDVRERLRGALQGVSPLLTDDDRVSVVTFADRVRVHHVAASPATVGGVDVGSVSAGGATTLLDAVLVGSQLARADARPALLLLFTDGADTASWTTAGRAIDTLRRTPVVVVTVGAGLPNVAPSPPDATYFRAPSWLAASAGDTIRLMRVLAETTGGDFVPVERTAALRDVFAAVLQRYRQRYLLSFTPRADTPAGWHRLDVRLRQRKGTVVARPGYIAAGQR